MSRKTDEQMQRGEEQCALLGLFGVHQQHVLLLHLRFDCISDEVKLGSMWRKRDEQVQGVEEECVLLGLFAVHQQDVLLLHLRFDATSERVQ